MMSLCLLVIRQSVAPSGSTSSGLPSFLLLWRVLLPLFEVLRDLWNLEEFLCVRARCAFAIILVKVERTSFFEGDVIISVDSINV